MTLASDRRARVAAGLAVCVAWLLHAALLAGLLAGAAEPVRVLIAGAVLVFLPGFAFVRLGLVPPGGAPLAAGWALGFGIAWNALLVLVLRAMGQGVGGLHAIALPATALLWIVAWRFGTRSAAPAAGAPARIAYGLVFLAALLAAWHVGRLGPLVTYQSDGPDHVGTVRRIVASGDAFPEDAFFADAGRNGVDPRKGVWHPQVAVIARLASVDAYDAWRWLPVAVAPMFVLNVAALGFLAARGPGMVIGAWALLFTLGGTLAQTPLRQAIYSSRLAEQLALAATAAVLMNLLAPSKRSRAAAALLGFAAVTTHLFAVVHLAVPLGALGVALLVRDRRWSDPLARLVATCTAMALASLPFLVWRAGQAYAPENVIHTEPQGLLYLAGGWKVMSLGFLWTTLSWCWVLAPLFWLLLWRWGRNDPVALWMLAATVTAAMAAYNPLLVAFLEPRVGYLLQRFLWFVPVALWLAWMLPRLAERAVQPARRVPALIALAAIGVTLVPAIEAAASLARSPGGILRSEWTYHVFRWRDALDWMRAHLPDDAVVLSDPVTSYSIPMMAGRYVVTLVDQHSSPNDPHALERLLDSRDALDAHAAWDRVREVVAQYGVEAIALNDRFEAPPRLDYWGPSHGWFRAARSRFDAHPDAFPVLFDAKDFVVYGVRHDALAQIPDTPENRPYVIPRVVDDRGVLDAREGLPDLVGLDLERHAVTPGDTLRGVARWHAPVAMAPGSYGVAVRLDRALPSGLRGPSIVGKPWRKLLERVRGETYRVTAHHLPVGGVYGVDAWRPEEVVLDSFRVVIPSNAVPGEFAVRVRMTRQPHFPNLHLRDYFTDDDLFAGKAVDTIRVVPPGGAE